jgi:hypothetical protein
MAIMHSQRLCTAAVVRLCLIPITTGFPHFWGASALYIMSASSGGWNDPVQILAVRSRHQSCAIELKCRRANHSTTSSRAPFSLAICSPVELHQHPMRRAMDVAPVEYELASQ